MKGFCNTLFGVEQVIVQDALHSGWGCWYRGCFPRMRVPVMAGYAKVVAMVD